MNFMLRIALQLLLAFFFLFVCIQVIVIVTAWLFWPQMITDGKSSGTYEIYAVILCAVLFLLTLLLIGWYLGKPVYFIVVWIRRLASGQYDDPLRWHEIHSREKEKLKMPYSVYKELFEHLRLLGNTLQKNEKDLQNSERAKREWIQGISHDLKTPLTYISGYSTMLINAEYRWSKEEQREFLSLIQQKAAHLQELVQDLNETIEGEIPLKSKEADIIELVRRTVADVSSAPWAADYVFIMNSKPDQIRVFCDQKLLTRAIRNLLVNAVVHNPKGTRIAVHVSQLQDRVMEIRIEDNGIGFSKTLIKSNSALTTSERSGLGLFIAQQLIEAHNGELTIISKPNEGTCLSIKLMMP
ncbi:HAMP domain-containing histidine kinase [Fictibacillus sp. WQ 8-8]|uniref:sensor histidine kinase n=1 Tax=Fictibacillus sp. WQ 8-8 TaxID=2938788 RepID=UPI00210C1499|nr:HAMP domain-containing sensor histidine kinase [Fictibacillus sp. WQ 8-8]MCQ6264704.1 HAMP domain-containing histidine kinase [Fictibacillus sp. WQ 8-8]